MTIKKDCPICKRPTVHLYTAPGGAMVCHRCLAIPKALNLARFRGSAGRQYTRILRAL